MRQKIICLIVSLAVAGVLSNATRASTFDAVADFNDSGSQPAAGNPWTYGTEVTLSTGFAALPSFEHNGNCSTKPCGLILTGGTVDDYYNVYPFSGASVAIVATGSLTAPLVASNNVLVMLAGSADYLSTDLVVTRFTAPGAGVFSITGFFSNLQTASVGLAVVVDGAAQFNSSFPSSSTAPFSINDVSLAQGATIDFVVDSLGDQSGDAVGLNAQISFSPAAVPGPIVGAGLPGLLAGFGAMLAWYRRQRYRIHGTPTAVI